MVKPEKPPKPEPPMPTLDPILLSKLLGPLPTMASVNAMGGHPKQWLDNFKEYEPEHYAYAKSMGTRMWEVANYYDRAKIYYWMAFATTGAESTEYLRKAHELALNYRINYAPGGNPSSHWSMPQGVYLHWLTTGDETSKTWCLKVAENMSNPYMYSQLGDINGEMDNRIQARVLEILVIAYLIGGEQVWADKLRQALPLVLQTQGADGAYRFTQVQNGGNKPFMVGLLNDALLLYRRAFEKDARITPAVRKACDYMWLENWRAEDKGFIYEEQDPFSAPDLNNLIINGFSMLGMSGHFPVIFEGALSSWLEGDKQFNQAYTSAAQTVATVPGAVSAWDGVVTPEPPDPTPPPEGEADVAGAIASLETAKLALAQATAAVDDAYARLSGGPDPSLLRQPVIPGPRVDDRPKAKPKGETT